MAENIFGRNLSNRKHLFKTPQQTKEETHISFKAGLPGLCLKGSYHLQKKTLKLRNLSRSLARITICLERKKSRDDQLQCIAERSRGALNGSYSLAMQIFKCDATCIIPEAQGLKTIFPITTLKGRAFLSAVTGKLNAKR